METTNNTNELLKELYISARTGIQAIDILKEKSKCHEFSTELQNQRQELADFLDQVTNKLSEHRVQVPDVSIIEKSKVWTKLQANTILNRSKSKLAELLIDSTHMGITDIAKQRNHYNQADHEVMILTENFIDMGEHSIEQARMYL
ncbi:MAG: hypothetical protein FWB72_04525 [Firmicutes bacterium]|nr:hypothetical protein [Bacillota bacterium]